MKFFFGKVEPKFEIPPLESLEANDNCSFIVVFQTVLDSHFYWGGSLLKGNGGVQRFSQTGRKLVVECKDIRKLNC